MEWRQVYGSELYEVSDTGAVRRCAPRLFKNRWGGITSSPASPKEITGCVVRGRYRQVLIYDGSGNRKWRKVHDLVAEAFLGPKPKGLEVNHKDSDKVNNHASNLEYVTKSQNAKHAIAAGHWPVRGLKGRYGTDR